MVYTIEKIYICHEDNNSTTCSYSYQTQILGPRSMSATTCLVTYLGTLGAQSLTLVDDILDPTQKNYIYIYIYKKNYTKHNIRLMLAYN